MEGLRKGSLFPFLGKQGRGERSVLPLPRASGGQPAGQGYLLLVAVPTCRASGFQGGVPCSRGESWRLPDRPPLAYFACFPVADGLSAPARRTLRRAGKPATGGGHAAHPLSGYGRVRFAPRGDEPVSVLHRMPGGMPRRTGPGMARGALEKADFQVESKKALPFAPAWDMDFRLCAGSGGMGPLTPHETNLRSYRC